MKTSRAGIISSVALLVLGLGVGAAAQVNPPVASNVPAPLQQQPSIWGGRFELFAVGSYETPLAATANSYPLSTSNVAGWQIGARIHGNDTNAFEFRFSFAQPLQTYGNQNLIVKATDTTYSMDYVRTMPLQGSIRPFFLGGVSVIHYVPTGGNNTAGASPQIRPGIDYGAGIDWKLTSQLSLRIEYREILYRIPDFALIGISQWNRMPIPDIGLAWHF